MVSKIMNKRFSAVKLVASTLAATATVSLAVMTAFVGVNPLVANAYGIDELEKQSQYQSIYGIDEYYINDATGYAALIMDGADYLTDSEEEDLIEKMEALTEYTNAIYVTDENNTSATESYSERLAVNKAELMFGSYESTIVYVVDNEYDYICSLGKAQKTISSSKAYSITDNVYTYSMKEKYYDGAVEAFDECLRLFKGKAIAEPMKYICNGFIGLFIGFIVCYAIVNKKSQLKRAGYDEMIQGAISFVNFSGDQVRFVNTTRTYSPRSSGGSGGHGGHGGGHHGGGHSGGGHSH